MKDKVSIIIVTYNRLNYLQSAIESILQQTYKCWELLIIGDGHQQDVSDYVSALNDNNILYFHVEHCGYPAKARNLGIQKSRYPYIAFCDDDDLWVYNKLELQMNAFFDDSSASLCFTNRNVIDSDSNLLATDVININVKHNLNRLLYTNYITYSSVLLKREILEKTGLFPDDINLKALEDYHLWIRIAYFGKIIAVRKSMVLYRTHQNNITLRSLSKGALRNRLVFNDLFSNYKFDFLYRLKAYLIVYLKVVYYKIMGK